LQFDKSFSDKIDWSLTGGLGHYPSIGLWKLIEEMGITTKQAYNSDQYAVNFNNLCREFRDNIPVRPLFVMEEKKCHDITEAMLNVNRVKMEQNKGVMENIYEESYNGNGSMRRPILSLMMWGPFADYELKKTDKKCDLNNSYGSLHVCENFSEKHYWMYTHGDGVLCETGTVRDLTGPAMTHDLKIIYPCNKSSCNQGCLCDLCLKSQMCPNKEHKRHIKDSNQECAVEKSIQCQDHWISHPENFNEKEDVVGEKNVFYHNKKLLDQPRKHYTEKLKFAGIKKSCKLCKSNVKNNFKFHKVIHMQCKYCEYQQCRE
jgi:hypothetical protein